MVVTPTAVPLQSSEAVAQWMEERIAQLADELADAVCAEVPSYAAARDVVWPQVREHAVDVWATFVRHVRREDVPQPPEFGGTARHATLRVDVGIPISDFLQAFRVGEQVLWRQVQTAAREAGAGDGAALGLAEVVMQTIEIASVVGLENWLVAHQQELERDARWRRELLDEVLAGRALESDARRLALAELGLDRRYAVLSVCCDGPDEEQLPEVARELESGLREIGSLSAVRRAELVAVLALDGPASALVGRLRRLVAGRPDLRAGVSGECSSLGDASAAYLEARLARDATRRSGPLLAFAELSLLERLALHHGDFGDRVVDRQIAGALGEDLASGGDLVRTLDAFVACDMRVREAAECLHVHPNTVYYRLDRLTERLGVDVRKVTQLIDVLTALRLLQAGTPRQA
ncbi:MAG: putative CdaR family transcriptional regulator [Nocardioidaceae bacterium]|nr:putative CdaR family transcriptional regulator [Nocardioidaceae bacterium]